MEMSANTWIWGDGAGPYMLLCGPYLLMWWGPFKTGGKDEPGAGLRTIAEPNCDLKDLRAASNVPNRSGNPEYKL